MVFADCNVGCLLVFRWLPMSAIIPSIGDQRQESPLLVGLILD